jgi:hypothetical protein
MEINDRTFQVAIRRPLLSATTTIPILTVAAPSSRHECYATTIPINASYFIVLRHINPLCQIQKTIATLNQSALTSEVLVSTSTASSQLIILAVFSRLVLQPCLSLCGPLTRRRKRNTMLLLNVCLVLLLCFSQTYIS